MLPDVLPGYDRTPLSVRHWLPEGGAPRATVVLVHGYAEHSGRYQALADQLDAQRCALVAYDQRGFGRSGGATALPPSFDAYVADLHAVTRRVRAHGSGPLFLMGHSMGGAVALLYCLDHGACPAGLVLSSPLLRLPAPAALLPPRLLERLAHLAGRLAPALPTVHLDRDAISRRADVVAAALADPLCYNGRIKARTGAEMIRATRRIATHPRHLRLPSLFLHGTADRITDPAGSRALHARARTIDKTLTLLDGFYHETFNDPGGDRVFAEVADWIDARAK